MQLCCRSPHGERGLKSTRPAEKGADPGRSPPRGAWIEIPTPVTMRLSRMVAPHHGERGLKCYVGVPELVRSNAPLAGGVD